MECAYGVFGYYINIYVKNRHRLVRDIYIILNGKYNNGLEMQRISNLLTDIAYKFKEYEDSYLKNELRKVLANEKIEYERIFIRV